MLLFCMCLRSWFVSPNMWGSGVTELLFSFLFTDWNRESQESLGQSGEDHWRLSTDEEGECNSHGKTETKIGNFFSSSFLPFSLWTKLKSGGRNLWTHLVQVGWSALRRENYVQKVKTEKVTGCEACMNCWLSVEHCGCCIWLWLLRQWQKQHQPGIDSTKVCDIVVFASCDTAVNKITRQGIKKVLSAMQNTLQLDYAKAWNT